MENLTEEDYIAVINSYSQIKWQPILDLVAEIEDVNNHHESQVGSDFFARKRSYTAIQSKLERLVYGMPLMIVFNWMSWGEGSAMVEDVDFDYNTIDIPTKCKLLTALVRNDRFSENSLCCAIEDGTVLKILKSIAYQLE